MTMLDNDTRINK